MTNSNTSDENGWNRYYVKSSGALTRDITVFGDTEYNDQLYKVDGKMFKKNAQVVDATGAVVLEAELNTIPFHVEFTHRDGLEVARLLVDSAFKDKYMVIGLVEGGEWVVNANKAEKMYTIAENDRPIVRIDLGSLALHKEFTIDYADGINMPLVVGVAWALNLAILQRIAGAGGAVAAT